MQRYLYDIMLESLKILTWNCNSPKKHRKSLLEDFAYTEDIDIIGLNEARQSMPKVLSNYHVVEASADLHVFIRRTLNARFIVLKNFHHVDCDLIVLQLSSLYLCFSYCRNGAARVGIDLLLSEVKLCCPPGSRLVIIGDLNAKSSFLPNPVTYMAGRVLDQFISSNEKFMIVNEKVYTFFRRNRNNSTLDLCIVTETLAQNLTDCLTLDQFDSDHKPVMCRFDLRHGPKLLLLPSNSFYQDMYPVRAANIRHIPDNFGTLLEEELVNVDIQSTSFPEDLWFTIEHSIVSV